MNKRGFAITGIMYISLLIFLMVVVGMLTVLGARKNLMDNYRKKILEEIETPAYANFYETTNLVAFYDSLINSKMIENSEITETTFYDVSENNNDGTLTGFDFLGNDEWKTDALVFDSAAANVDSGLAGDLYTSFTIEAYFKMNSVVATGADPVQSNTGVILGSYGATHGFGVSWITEDSDDTKYKLVAGARDAGGTNYIVGPEIYDFTKKIHVALVYSDSLNELSFYIDGILVDVVESVSLSLSTIGNIEANIQHVYDGNFEAAPTKMDLYTVRIYDRALASNEVSGNKAVDKVRVNLSSTSIGGEEVVVTPTLPNNEDIEYIYDLPNIGENATPCEINTLEFTHILDKRDTKTYAVTKIGTQCWFAENLAYTGNGCLVSEGTTWDNTAPFNACDVNGGTGWDQNEVKYQWGAAMDGNDGLSGEPVQGLCPVGWVFPTDSNWLTLTDYLSANSEYWCGGVSTQIGKALSSTTNWDASVTTCDVGNDQSLNNLTGFNGNPAGSRLTSGDLFYIGSHGLQWSSTPTSSNAWRRYLSSDNPGVILSSFSQALGGSVRCIKTP